jgi:GTP-binding protein
MVDQAKIVIEAGQGGSGVATFRREKYIPFGGPSGGDGGDGGDVIIKVNPQLSTLSQYTRTKFFKAEDGKPGQNQKKHGRNGDDLVLYVPLGTEIYTIVNDKERKATDLINKDDSYIITRGGKGGLGNCHFATSTHQTPQEFTPGEPGEKVDVRLNLKLIADVAVIGLPNIGKSTFISLISNAKPKIANYAFTTLEPTLGKVDYKGVSFVIADIPGLIEGASSGKGLGDKFLQHIDRTRLLVHFIAGDSVDPFKDYSIVRQELANFDKSILDRQEILVLSRYDLVNEGNKDKIKEFESKYKAIHLSQFDRESSKKVLDKIIAKLN